MYLINIHNAKSKRPYKYNNIYAEWKFKALKQPALTVSIGAKEFTNEESVSILIDNADKLLYIAKENGRNRIEY